MLDPTSHGELLRMRDLIQAHAGLRLEESKLLALFPRLAPIAESVGAQGLSGLNDMLMREMAFGAGKAWAAVI
ncbi:MAG TPA: hypothetical protein V6D05_13285, partial [Stenomitos sp.]